MSHVDSPEQVTVLGGHGYIGQHLAAYLQQLGHDCWVPQRDDPSILQRPLGTVFYCIGLTADFRSRPFETVDAHVGVLSKVLQHGRFDQLIYLSSTRVYLGASDTYEDQTLTVNTQVPDDLYKLSKLLGESLVLHSGRPGKVVRLSNVVGGTGGNHDSFVYSLMQDARRGAVLLRSAPESAKDYICMDDVTSQLAQIAWRGQHKVYNLASGIQTTHAQWLEFICAENGCTWSVLPNAPLQQFLPIRIERIQSEFGFIPKPVMKDSHGFYSA
ncbi:MAG: NAD-dependent epimerase/dehydratase [Comamonadaceae bacterium]|nr:MAG: NAD-dependent epimerase/dehydratase [Comamonadaceae bacterium]